LSNGPAPLGTMCTSVGSLVLSLASLTLIVSLYAFWFGDDILLSKDSELVVPTSCSHCSCLIGLGSAIWTNPLISFALLSSILLSLSASLILPSILLSLSTFCFNDGTERSNGSVRVAAFLTFGALACCSFITDKSGTGNALKSMLSLLKTMHSFLEEVDVDDNWKGDGSVNFKGVLHGSKCRNAPLSIILYSYSALGELSNFVVWDAGDKDE